MPMATRIARVVAFGFQTFPARLWNRPQRAVCCAATRTETDERWMRVALEEARSAGGRGEVPVGAVIVSPAGNALGRAGNGVELFKDPTMHAEMRAIRAATAAEGNWRLLGCTLYATLEPCAMCLSAAALARVARIVYGAPDLRIGACGTWVDLAGADHPFHRFEDVHGGVLADESRELLQRFFRERRKEKAAKKAAAKEETDG